MVRPSWSVVSRVVLNALNSDLGYITCAILLTFPPGTSGASVMHLNSLSLQAQAFFRKVVKVIWASTSKVLFFFKIGQVKTEGR